MDKHEYIDIFNSMIKGTPVSFKEKLLPMISEYLTEIKYENSDKMINLIVQNPQLIQRFIPESIEYYCRKFYILSIIFKNKTILYYE